MEKLFRISNGGIVISYPDLSENLESGLIAYQSARDAYKSEIDPPE